MWCIGICILLLVLYIAGLFLTRNYQKEFVTDLDKKEHGFRFFYPLSLFFILETPIYGYLDGRKQEKENLSLVYVETDSQFVQIMYWCKKISLILFIGAVFIILSLAMELGKGSTGILREGNKIVRNDIGDGDVSLPITVKGEGKEKEKITITVPERIYTEEEIAEKLKEAKAYVKANYLGENSSCERVNQRLNLMEKIPDSLIKISWSISDESIVQSDGNINNVGIIEDGLVCELAATLSYEDEVEEILLKVRVIPPESISREQWKQAINQAIEQATGESPQNPTVKLPDNILGFHVDYQETKSGKGMVFLAFGAMVLVVLWIFYDKDLITKRKKHDEQMLLDYPELVNKFTLLLGAGMTISGAWEKIAIEYETKKNQNKINMRYAYEEWCMGYYEMKNGVSKGKAIEDFGQRVKLLPYLKFSSMLVQNLKKGSKGLLELLEYEALDSFEQRKQMTKRLAEEASTKLLAPMMIMLGIVLIIIMIPAILTL